LWCRFAAESSVYRITLGIGCGRQTEGCGSPAPHHVFEATVRFEGHLSSSHHHHPRRYPLPDRPSLSLSCQHLFHPLSGSCSRTLCSRTLSSGTSHGSSARYHEQIKSQNLKLKTPVSSSKLDAVHLSSISAAILQVDVADSSPSKCSGRTA
jgi:hypothetical protein